MADIDDMEDELPEAQPMEITDAGIVNKPVWNDARMKEARREIDLIIHGKDGPLEMQTSIETINRARKYVLPRVQKSDDQKAAMARQRAFRGHCMRRLQKFYKTYQPFSIEEAATLLKMEQMEMEKYLRNEASLGSSRIEQGEDGKFFICSVFD